MHSGDVTENVRDSLGTDACVRELDDVSCHHNDTTASQQEVVWRRANLSADVRDAASSCAIIKGKGYKGDYSTSSELGCSEKYEVEFRGMVFPTKPLYLIRTHVYSSLSIGSLVATVIHVLNCVADLEFDFISESLTWNALFLRRSAHSEMTISIYSSDDGCGCDSGDLGTFIVEVNRLSGDAEGPRNVFNSLKRALNKDDASAEAEAEVEVPPVERCSPLTVPPLTSRMMEPLSITDLSAALQPLLRMATEKSIDAKVESSKIICDLAHNEAMQQPLCESGCLRVLGELIASTAPDQARRHAVLAIAHLSASMACQEAFIDSGVVPVLLNISGDSSNDKYDRREMKREAARAIANISVRFGEVLITTLGQDTVSSWLKATECTTDERLKLHVKRARDHFPAIASTKIV